MKSMRRYSPLTVLVVAAALFIVGCDSSDGSDGISESAVQDMNGMMTDVFSVLDGIMMTLESNPQEVSTGKASDTSDPESFFKAWSVKSVNAPLSRPAFDKSSMPTFLCESGGSVDYEISETDDEFAWSLTFEDCEGINGHLDFGFTSSNSDTQPYETEFYMDGELTERCTLRYDNWRMKTSFYVDEETNEFSGSMVYDGSVSATCGSESFACTYDNVTVDFNDIGDGSELYEGYCG